MLAPPAVEPVGTSGAPSDEQQSDEPTGRNRDSVPRGCENADVSVSFAVYGAAPLLLPLYVYASLCVYASSW